MEKNKKTSKKNKVINLIEGEEKMYLNQIDTPIHTTPNISNINIQGIKKLKNGIKNLRWLNKRLHNKQIINILETHCSDQETFWIGRELPDIYIEERNTTTQREP